MLTLLAICRRKLPNLVPAAAIQTQPDADDDICDMAVEDRDAEALMIRLVAANEEQDVDEKVRLRNLAMGTYLR